MRGDRVDILIDNGSGQPPIPFSVEATKNGRKVEVRVERQMILVQEITRYGDPVRTSRFMASRVVAMTEHKTEEAEEESRPEEPSLFGGDQ